MRKLLCFLFVSSALIMGSCVQDDLHRTVDHHRQFNDPLEGNTFTVDQKNLESIYSGNENLKEIFKNQFKKDLSNKTINSLGSKISTRIDLDHIQVYEAKRLHAITYSVHVFDEKGDPTKEIYNLMYYSTDKENYYVTLLKYDFSKVSFPQFLKNPSVNEVLYLYPLEDYQDIDKEIYRTISSVNPIYVKEIIPLGDCVKEVSVVGKPCNGEGHEYGDPRCRMTGSDRATPSYSYMDFSECGKGSSGGGGGSSPGPGTPGGPSNPGAGFPGGPIKVVTPVRHIGDLIKSEILLGQINIGNNNANVKMLKAISSLLNNDIKSLYGKLNEFREYGSAHKFGRENGSYTYTPVGGKITLPNSPGSTITINLAHAILAYYGVIHTHPISFGNSEQAATPLFSAGDLSSLFRLTNKSTYDPNRKPSEAFVGVVNKYGTYIVMVPNNVTTNSIVEKYDGFVVNEATDGSVRIKGDLKGKKFKFFERDLKKEYSYIAHSNYSEDVKKKKNEEALLRMMKKYELDLNIYFLESNNGSFDKNWQQLSLNNGQIQYTNIN